MKICCILNEKSGGSGTVDVKMIAALFEKQGVELNIIKLEAETSIRDVVSRAISQMCNVIVAGGGDGTINAVVTAIIGHPSLRLGILPLGTLNHFSRDLGIPPDISQAVDVICAGASKAIDMGSVNDRFFLNNSSVGLYPAIVKMRETLQGSGYGKWWAALIASIRILGRFRRFDLDVQPTKGPSIACKTALLFVGNNKYETRVGSVGTRLSIDRGKLWVTMPASRSRTGFFLNLVALMLRREKPDDMTFEATALNVKSRQKLLTVATDGEIFTLKPPLNYKILPKALTVIVPQSKYETP